MPHKKSTKPKWSAKIKTDSTHPPPKTFTKDAKTVARTMASKKVSPGGLGSAIRMIQMFINRAGKNLDADRKHELEHAKHLLQTRKSPAKKKSPRKKMATRKK